MSDKDKKDNEQEKEWLKDEHFDSDSLLRQTLTHNIRLIADADRKARIMIVVNSILLTLGITTITKLIDHVPHAWMSAVILMISNLLSLFFTILSVRPEIKGNLSKEIENNILHFSKVREYNYKEYELRVRELIHDNEKKIESLIKDLYYYGQLLINKYRLMKVAFRIFYWGLAFAVVSYVVFVAIRSSHA
jgi:hypothetical protein